MDSDPPLPSPPRYSRKIKVARESTGTRSPFPYISSAASKSNLDRFLGSSGTLSSDPPLFSSDDFQSSALENYDTNTTADAQANSSEEATGRKRRYRGTWWGQKLGSELQPKKNKRTKRTGFKNKRNIDSGVWLGSADTVEDGDESAALFTCGSDDSVFCEGVGLPTGRRDAAAATTGRASASRSFPLPGPAHKPRDGSDKSSVAKGNRTIESEAHTKARQIINTCLDDGNDRVDLSYLDMKTVPSHILPPLTQLTKQPTVLEHGNSIQIFSPLEPSLQLYLTRNSLTYVPKEVFDLWNIRFLSLRQNKLTEIPGAIRKLILLQELNVGGNKLRYLPWEIIGLMQGRGALKNLTLYPNRFLRMDESEIVQWHVNTAVGGIVALDPNTREGEADYNTPAIPSSKDDMIEEWKPIHVATSAAEYLDMEGRPMGRRRTTPTNTPSLRDLALKACSRSPNLSRFLEEDEQNTHSPASGISSSLPSTSANAHYQDPIVRLLTFANEVRQTGEKVCSVCSRSRLQFVVG
ncbi:leucine Rich Repeat domain-containing protein [Arthroderma uncinatum]|uniref:leucine Rich Repeat domain-containing protein n=1 Tax=Arthroderma uncinatum TaxID=74035 RepID=UPI00144AD19E|nr:leucine Rich Repeat domain-containing protein [Arthroderma uncinatum]KAF3490909.1 leucine Rich Repeat domain-containing protein [Arthroderma uncinatum]